MAQAIRMIPRSADWSQSGGFLTVAGWMPKDFGPTDIAYL